MGAERVQGVAKAHFQLGRLLDVVADDVLGSHRPIWRTLVGTLLFNNGIPASINGSRSGLLAAELVDVDNDGDGRRDLVLLNVTAGLQGYYCQILRQTSARVFADESIPRIIKDANTWEGIGAPFIPWIHMADLNGDGKLDVAIGDNSSFLQARNLRWMNDGTGVFKKAPWLFATAARQWVKAVAMPRWPFVKQDRYPGARHPGLRLWQ